MMGMFSCSQTKTSDMGVLMKTIKQCACGRSYTQEEFDRLKYIGIQRCISCSFTVRDCECGSALLIPNNEGANNGEQNHNDHDDSDRGHE